MVYIADCYTFKRNVDLECFNLDRERKKAFKSYIHRIKDLAWLKELNIEIQENDEGKWIEIHLNETADDKEDDRVLEEDPDEDD